MKEDVIIKTHNMAKIGMDPKYFNPFAKETSKTDMKKTHATEKRRTIEMCERDLQNFSTSKELFKNMALFQTKS